jgi:hypothetical protein
MSPSVILGKKFVMNVDYLLNTTVCLRGVS